MKIFDEKTIEEKLTRIDILFNKTDVDIKNILLEVNKEFPKELVMAEDFKGTHSIILDEKGKLQLNIWCNEDSYIVTQD